MKKRDLGQEILAGVKEVSAFNQGKIQLKKVALTDPSPAADIRRKLSLSQAGFAALMGVSVRTLQDWEQGRRKPKGPAKSLLRVAEKHPEVFTDIT